MSPDSGERSGYARVREVFFGALDVPGPERAAWVREACGGDLELREEVEALLANHTTRDGFLEGRAGLSLDALAGAVAPVPPPVAPSEIGPFRVLRVLGSGGMGVVFLAEQEHPRRRVALKLLGDVADPRARKRFDREVDALARLQHPGIAQVFEAGCAEVEGVEVPYFAMEYVEGVSILRHAEAAALDVRGRLDLFARVCDAVQHAHERGVLHRDLKPENVLVDREGDPRVLDFGVAQLIDPRQRSRITRTGHLLGTFAYMSPEQARGSVVDARGDQYALGVLLYELLTAHLPFEAAGGAVEGTLRRLSHETTVAVSVRDPKLGGDVETIVHKAIDPEPSRRYASVADLAADVRRYLVGEPIQARPPTTAYVLRRFVGQNRVLTASVLSTGLALVVGLGVAISAWRAASDAERERAAESAAVQRLSQGRCLRELEERADELWPIEPARVPALRQWLEEADEMRDHLPEHRAFLAHLDELAARGELDSATTSAVEVPGGMRWVHDLQRDLVARFERFYDEDDPLAPCARIRARLALAEQVEAATVAAHRGRWDRELAVVADPSRSPYGGLLMEPQVGLVPLGPDPDSGLQEFALWGPTGEVPLRHDESDRLVLGERTTVVFVLIPGGEYWIGCQREDPDGTHYDPYAQQHEGPPRRVWLDPFLISKFEATQGQWSGLLGENPSYWAAGKEANGRRMTLAMPVDRCSYEDARQFCRRLGGDLPTEAQWEVAARAGTRTPFWTGGHPDSLVGRANIRLHHPTDLDGLTLDDARVRELDPHRLYVEVGTFTPNPWGLYDVTGNLWEWCRDVFKVEYHDLPLRAGDGLVLATGDAGRSLRGGSSTTSWEIARIGFRNDAIKDDRAQGRTLRPVRALSGAWSLPGREKANSPVRSGALPRSGEGGDAVASSDR